MQRRDIELLLVSGLVGPPLASFCFLLASTVGRYGLAGLATLDIAFVTGTWPFAYLFAFLPTLIAAAGNALVARWALSQLSRLALSLPIGAIPLLLSLSWLAEDDASGQMQIGELVSLGFAGAMTSLLCVALVESFGTALREQG
jgi:hypothetical protein